MNTGVRELLHTAAATPASDLDVAALAGAARRRRTVRVACAVAATAAIVMLGAVVALSDVSGRDAQTPLRPVSTAVPDATKAHAIVVTPNTSLRDGQPIRVSGRNFVVGVGHGGHPTSVSVVTCRAGATSANWDQQCDPRTSGGTAEADIRFREPVRAAKRGHPARENCCADVAGYRYAAARHLELPGGTVDCALEPCVVLAVGLDSGYGSAPLHFDPDVAPLPTPRVTVTPADDLQEGQQVTVDIEDAWPSRDNRGAIVSLCVVRPGATPICDGTGPNLGRVQSIDSHGHVALTTTAKSTVLSSGCCTLGDVAAVADCTQPPGCVVGVQVPAGPLGGQIAKIAVPITFSAAVSARPIADRLPHATIDPPGPYADGQEVTISATGVPGVTTVGVCAKVPGPGGAFQLCAPGGTTGTGTLVLHRFVEENSSDPLNHKRIDCAEPGNCSLVLYTSGDSAGAIPPLPLLEFGPVIVN